MRLGEALSRIPDVRLIGSPEEVIRGVSHDSRRIEPGYVFAALPGAHHHGLEFLEEAVARGATCVLSDHEPAGHVPVPWILSSHPRRATAELAWAVAGDPQLKLRLVGITGTNGKTTVAGLTAECLQAAGFSTGVFGTLNYRLPGRESSADRTTPEAPDLAPLLAELVEADGKVAVMEVSSHALAQQRVAGLRFDVAVWTNLSRDHLDYHHTLEEYFSVKRRLFDEHLAEGGRRVLPIDEPWGRKLLAEPHPTDLTYGLDGGAVTARAVETSLDGTRFELVLPGATAEVQLELIGIHNVRNALAASGAALVAGADASSVFRGLQAAQPLPGRLSRVPVGLPFPVFIDFAHTPDGLQTVLTELRRLTPGRLIVVFGAGGDRDVGKREPMGQAVGAVADLAIVTSDNPRSEDPAAIAAAVADGVRAAGGRPVIELDRRAAIEQALGSGTAGSVVVIAGKGHETDQELSDRTVPFCDRSVVLELAGGTRCA